MADETMLPVECRLVERIMDDAKKHGWTKVLFIWQDHKIVDIQCENHVPPTTMKSMYQMPVDSFDKS